MNVFNVPYKKVSETAIEPTYGTEESAGLDLYAYNPAGPDAIVSIAPGETVMISSGIAMHLPKGYVGLLFARSGISTKRDLAPANKVGVVDSDYRGEIYIPLHNHGSEIQTVTHGERIAQLVLVEYSKMNLVEVTDLEDSERGDHGFGSTGSN